MGHKLLHSHGISTSKGGCKDHKILKNSAGMEKCTFPLRGLHGQARCLMEIKMHKANTPISSSTAQHLGAEGNTTGYGPSPLFSLASWPDLSGTGRVKGPQNPGLAAARGSVTRRRWISLPEWSALPTRSPASPKGVASYTAFS